MTDDEELERLKEQTNSGDRLDESATGDDTDALREDIVTYLGEIDDGDRQKTVSVWDGELTALFTALGNGEHDEELADLGRQLREEFDIQKAERPNRSEVLSLCLRLGLREAAPEYSETLREAVKEHATADL